MPWKATDTMKERTKLVLEWERRWDAAEGGPVNMAELGRMFGVSRQTGYTWVGRYRTAGLEMGAVAERSRRPKTSPTAISAEVEDLIVEARKRWPTWGPRKLHARLVEANPGRAVPSASVMSKVLKRRGLTQPRRRRRRAPSAGVSAPFLGCERPNDVWCIDFKGWFETRDGVRCYPLTLLDGFSRYLLRCESLLDPDGIEVRRVLDSAFQEFGLPLAIRSDGGPPFASTGPARLTELSVWLLQLGIKVEIIAPGKPQQNGRLERLHRTLKAEVASPPAETWRAQQRRFDVWRRTHNQGRIELLQHIAIPLQKHGKELENVVGHQVQLDIATHPFHGNSILLRKQPQHFASGQDMGTAQVIVRVRRGESVEVGTADGGKQ